VDLIYENQFTVDLRRSRAATLGTSTSRQPADAIFTLLSQVSQAVSVLRSEIADLERLRCLSLIHASQFTSDCEFLTASYHRLRLLLQREADTARPTLAENPLHSTNFKFRFTSSPNSKLPSDSFKLRHALKIDNIIASVQFSPNGELFACADKKILYLFSESDATLRQFDLPGDSSESSTFLSPRRLRFSKGGKILAISAQKNSIAMFSLENSNFVGILNSHQAVVNTLLFSCDSGVLYSGGIDGSVFVWDVSSFQMVRQLKHGRYQAGDPEDAVLIIVGLDFIDQGRVLLVMFMANKVLFYRLPELATPKSAVIHHEGLVLDCRSLPDQIHFATVSQDTTVKVWKYGDVVECVATLIGHNNLTIAICFSPDQTFAFTGLKDATLAMWRWNRNQKSR
jgi:WD40 repeat protein